MAGNKKALRGFWLKQRATSFVASPSKRRLGDLNKGSFSSISKKGLKNLNSSRPKTKPIRKSQIRKGRVGGRTN